MSNSPDLSDVLCVDPQFIDPGQPTGFWFCADPEDVLAVQVNAGCIRSDAGWEVLGRFEAFFLRFCHVVVVCADPDRRAVMVRELRQRLPNVILLAVEDRGFLRCSTFGSLQGFRPYSRCHVQGKDILRKEFIDINLLT